jgi:hypothetical protein
VTFKDLQKLCNHFEPEQNGISQRSKGKRLEHKIKKNIKPNISEQTAIVAQAIGLSEKDDHDMQIASWEE